MNEKLLEKKLREKIKELGGIALKFYSMSFTGLPDRIVLMPGGRVWFAEIKTTGQKLKPRQLAVIELFRKLGFSYHVIDRQEALDFFLKEVQR